MCAPCLCSALDSHALYLTYLLVALQRIIGVQPAWMRPPYGNINDQVRLAATTRGQNGAQFLMTLSFL